MIKKKILFFDVETSTLDLLHRNYGLKSHTKYFDYREIVRDWTMLSAAWKWQGEKKVYSVAISPDDPLNDKEIVTTLYEILDEAEILVGHNIDRFDIRKFNARAIKHGLPPLGRKLTRDTLKIARKHFDCTSNTLGYLAAYLDVGHKEGRPDWDAVLRGDKDAIRYMVKYNRQDVIVTEGVYNKLAPWDTAPPNMNLAYPIRDTSGAQVVCCRVCQSPEIVSNGTQLRANGGRVQTYKCRSCGHRMAGERIT